MTVDGHIQLFPLVRVVLALAAGIVAGDALHDTVASWMWLCVLAAAVALAAVALWKRAHPVLQTSVLLVAVAVCGAWRVSVSSAWLDVAFGSSEETFTAVVASPPVARGRTLRCELIVADGRLAGHRMYGYFARPVAKLLPGDGLTITSRVTDMVGKGSGGASAGNAVRGALSRNFNFDYRRWLRVHDIVACTYVPSGQWCRTVVGLGRLSGLQRLQTSLGRTRHRLLVRCAESGMPEGTLALVAAMTLGDRSMLAPELRETYSVAGASHVLALSGLHIGIIYFLLSLVLVRGGRPSVMQAVVLVAVWGYVAMTGVPLSAVRSAIMLTAFTFAALLGRQRVSLNTLALSALLILACSPQSLWDVGFQMSLLAVAGIIMLQGRLYRLLPLDFLMSHRLAGWCWSLVTVSLSAQMAVAPVVAYYFGRFSCYFLLSNFFAVPLATALIYTSLVMYAASIWPWLQGWLAVAVGWEVSALNGSLGWVASLPGASIDGININGVQLAVIYVFFALVWLLLMYAGKLYRSAHGVKLGKYAGRKP